MTGQSVTYQHCDILIKIISLSPRFSKLTNVINVHYCKPVIPCVCSFKSLTVPYNDKVKKNIYHPVYVKYTQYGVDNKRHLDETVKKSPIPHNLNTLLSIVVTLYGNVPLLL